MKGKLGFIIAICMMITACGNNAENIVKSNLNKVGVDVEAVVEKVKSVYKEPEKVTKYLKDLGITDNTPGIKELKDAVSAVYKNDRYNLTFDMINGDTIKNLVMNNTEGNKLNEDDIKNVLKTIGVDEDKISIKKISRGLKNHNWFIRLSEDGKKLDIQNIGKEAYETKK